MAVLVLASAVLVAALADFGGDRSVPVRDDVRDDAGYQQSQSRIAIGSGERVGLPAIDDPLAAGERRAQTRTDGRRARRALRLLREADPDGRWRVRRVVIAPGATWVFTGLGTSLRDRPSLVAICRALVDRFPWADAVSTIGQQRTPGAQTWVLVEGETPADCAETRVVESQSQ